jgi:hypothetical protein
MGITWRWRAQPLTQTFWYQAYASTNPDGQFDTSQGSGLYEILMQLFSAIQMAGPDLKPDTVQRGLDGYSRTSGDSSEPNAGYTVGLPVFIQDFSFVRWDASRQPPGGGQAQLESNNPGGCYVHISDKRHGRWPHEDQSQFPGICGADWESSAGSASS